ncbi:MAG: hypothetical protein AAGE52_16520 [Myxococcota bacterium]
MRGVFSGVVIAALCGLGAPASAQSCDPAVEAWGQDCDLRLRAHFCDGPIVVFRIEGHDERLELRRGETEVAVVGEVPDLSALPEVVQSLRARLPGCALENDPFVLDTQPVDVPRVDAKPAPPRPWRALLGLLLLVAVLWRARRRIRATEFLGVYPLLYGAALLRLLLTPVAYFHMNGQGPLWIDYARCGSETPYGPGYRDLFGHAATLAGNAPETGVFLQQSLSVGLVPPLLALSLRGAGVSRALSLAIAALAIVDPALARLARSESYFGVAAVLVLAAVTALLWGMRRHRLRTVDVALATCCAALFIASAARTHPTTWLVGAIVPLVLVCLPFEGVRRSVLAGALIGVFVVPLALPSIVATLQGDLGRWLETDPSLLPPAAALLAFAAVPLARRRPTAFLIALATFLAVGVTTFQTHVAWLPPSMLHGMVRMHLPVVVVLVAALLSRVPRRRWHRMVLTVGTLLVAVPMLGSIELPTDAREQRWLLRHRGALSNQRVAFVERAGERVFFLPFHSCIESHPVPVPIDAAAADLPEADVMYFGSLCATPEGREVCHRLRRRAGEVIDQRALPATTDVERMRFVVDRVEVSLRRTRNSDL